MDSQFSLVLPTLLIFLCLTIYIFFGSSCKSCVEEKIRIVYFVLLAFALPGNYTSSPNYHFTNPEFPFATAYRPPDSIAAKGPEVLEEFLHIFKEGLIYGSCD